MTSIGFDKQLDNSSFTQNIIITIVEKCYAGHVWSHDIQHNGNQHNDTQHNYVQHNGLNCDTQHNYVRHEN